MNLARSRESLRKDLNHRRLQDLVRVRHSTLRFSPFCPVCLPTRRLMFVKPERPLRGDPPHRLLSELTGHSLGREIDHPSPLEDVPELSHCSSPNERTF